MLVMAGQERVYANALCVGIKHLMMEITVHTVEQKWTRKREKMYKSPIEIELNDFVYDIVKKEDEYTVKCIQQVGVNVDKDELIKTLEYDREQYEKGWNDRDNEIVRCKDCEHSKHWYRDKHLCYLWSETGIGVFEDGYCSYGERRKDEID